MRDEIVVLAADVTAAIRPAVEEYGVRGFARQVARYRGSQVGGEERRLTAIMGGEVGIQHVSRAEALLFAATGDHMTLAALPHLSSSLPAAEEMVDAWVFARGYELSEDEKTELALTLARFCAGFVVGATDANPQTAPTYRKAVIRHKKAAAKRATAKRVTAPKATAKRTTAKRVTTPKATAPKATRPPDRPKLPRPCARVGCRNQLAATKQRNARFCSIKCGDADYQLRLKANRSLQPSTA